MNARLSVASVFIALALAASARAGLIATADAGFESPSAVTSPLETPTGWGPFNSGTDTSGVSNTVARTGDQSLAFTAAGDAGGYQGYYYIVPIAGSDGTTVSYSAYLRADAASPLSGTAFAKLGIEVKGASGELFRRELEIHPDELSTTEWRPFTITADLTSEVTSLAFTIVEVNGSGPYGGTFYADDTSAAAVPEPATLGLGSMAVAALLLRRHR